MKKVLFFLALAVVLALPISAQAQTPVALDVVQVQFWPEYDQPSVLVIVDFKVAANTALPASVTMRIPAEANLLAVAMDSPNGLIIADYAAPATEGKWMLIPINVTANVSHRVEYYVPLTKNGMERDFTYVWPGDYSVTQFQVTLQEATGSTNVKITPDLPSIQPDNSGLIYHNGAFSNLEAGKEFPVNVKYSRVTDDLSVASLNVEPAGNLNEDTTGRTSLSNALPIILALVGLALIGGGAFWYWQSGKTNNVRSRRRHTRRTEETDEGDDDAIYCSQCGKRAQASDRFCRACGTKIERKAS